MPTTADMHADVAKPARASSKLAALAQMTVIVADTGDLEAVRRLKPQDCTTNPSLLLKAASTDAGLTLLNEAAAWAMGQTADASSRLALACERFACLIVVELSRVVPGLVSIEVDADLSFDVEGTVRKGKAIVAMLAALGVPRERVLIKVAGTWEGIEATRRLQAEDIDCNVTLIFNVTQALAAAQAKAFLISPFVGRVTDWHVQQGEGPFEVDKDPGVRLVREIYRSVKGAGSLTVVMGASFRTTAQIEALAGCDRLTIAPALLDALSLNAGAVTRRLLPPGNLTEATAPIAESDFRSALAGDRMAREKLDEGIRQFPRI
jgi:transaldolase